MPWSSPRLGVFKGVLLILALGLLLLLRCTHVNSYRVDTSITKYRIEPRICYIYMQPCKKTYRRYFECKCPGLRPACVGPGKYYDARCIPEEWVSYGRKWIQPDS